MTAALTISVMSCSDFMELKPKNELSLDEFYKTSEQIESALNGAYSSLQESHMYGNWYIYGDIASDDTYNQLSGSVTDQDEFDRYYIRTTNPYINGVWNTSYEAINRTNTILTRSADIEMSEELKARYQQEAKFLRALFYFNIVRIFGDVPLVLKEISIEEAYKYMRESKDKVYAQIIADLNEAKGLPASYDKQNAGRATSGAARALLAKVYLTLHDYQKAEEELAAVVNSGTYALLENATGSLNIDGYASYFNPNNHNNAESIFEVQFKKGGFSEGSNFANRFAPNNSGTNVIAVGTGGGDNIPELEMYNAYEEGDLRRDFSVKLGYNDNRKGGEWVEARYISKYFDTPYQANDNNNNYPLIRYADVLLMYAEALNQNGKTTEACDYLNQVRRRGFGYQTSETSPVDKAISSKEEFALAVENERRFELAFEGHRWYDLIRTGRAVEVLTSKGFKLNESNTIYPIPQKQIDVNPKLTQNKYDIIPK